MPDHISRFEQLVAQQPANELFRFSLGQALMVANRGPEAEPHLRHCVNQKSDWMLPRILLGKHLFASGRRAEARALLEDALRLAIEQGHDDPAEELRNLLDQF